MFLSRSVCGYYDPVSNNVSLIPVELSKKKDNGKYGIGYFSPDNCDHGKVPCKFVAYPEFANLKAAYTSTKNATLTMTAYTPQLNKILKCPKAIDSALQPTPKVLHLKCSVAQPVCGGAKANAFPKDPRSFITMGEKKKPSNAASNADLKPKKKSAAVTSSAATAQRAVGSALYPVVAAAAVALWLLV